MIIDRVFLEELKEELNGDWKTLEPRSEWQKEPDRLQSGNRILRIVTSNMAADRGKVIIYGIYPHKSNVESVIIKVSLDRGIQAIAKSIEKRLLPKYESNLVIAEEQIQKQNDYEEKLCQTKSSIGKAMNTHQRNHGSDHFVENIKEVHTRARINSPTGIILELSLDEKKAVKVIEFLKTL